MDNEIEVLKKVKEECKTYDAACTRKNSKGEKELCEFYLLDSGCQISGFIPERWKL